MHTSNRIRRFDRGNPYWTQSVTCKLAPQQFASVVLSSRRSQVGEEKKKRQRKKKKLDRETKERQKKNGVRRHSGTRCLIVPLSVGRSRPPLSSLFVPRFRSVCVSVFGLVCIIMARWWLFSIILVITTFFIIVTVNAERHHHDSIIQLLKDPEQLQIIHAMLKNYKAKLMKSPFGDSVNSMGPPVWVGNSPPPLPNGQDFNLEPDSNDTFVEETVKRSGHLHHNHRLVRSRNEPLSEEICKTNRYWKQINDTRDIYGQEVRIVHSSEYRQFAFVYECIREGDPCSGISEHLQSTCEMRPGWANMLHVKLATLDTSMAPQWGYVAVPHHCACRIYPRVNPFIP